MKLLALCDSPTVNTGFARVAQNLLKRWRPYFEDIDVWGVNYHGFPHDLKYVDNIFPATFSGNSYDWNSVENMNRFLHALVAAHEYPKTFYGPYTHLWILQDTFQLSHPRLGVPKVLWNDACKKYGIKSLMYFPCDAPFDPWWTDILRAVNTPVAYTHYAKRQAESAMRFRKLTEKKDAEKPLRPVDEVLEGMPVLPHGVDTAIYRPLPDREKIRAEFVINPLNGYKLSDFVKPDEFLMLNVNCNQRRKDTPRTLALLAKLREMGCTKHKLLMHMNPEGDSLNLEIIGANMGLVSGKDWIHTGDLFSYNNSQMPEDWLNQLYNCADLYVSTTLGEGFGLGQVEALAAGCPIAIPDHTACGEIVTELWKLGQKTWDMCAFPVSEQFVCTAADNSRVRYPVNVKLSAEMIADTSRFGRVTLTDQARRWLSWERIAGEWIRLFRA